MWAMFINFCRKNKLTIHRKYYCFTLKFWTQWMNTCACSLPVLVLCCWKMPIWISNFHNFYGILFVWKHNFEFGSINKILLKLETAEMNHSPFLPACKLIWISLTQWHLTRAKKVCKLLLEKRSIDAFRSSGINL